MSVSSSTTSANIDDTEMRPFLEHCLTSVIEEHGDIVSIGRKDYPYQSSCAMEELDLHYADDNCMQLIFKNLSRSALLESAQNVRPEFGYDACREIRVYRDILSKSGLATARYWGSVIDPAHERYWLLIEKVPGEELYEVGDFSAWRRVAEWLAKMHITLAELPARGCECSSLLHYDEAFYKVWMDRAARFLLESGETPNGVGTDRIHWLSAQYRRTIQDISGLPRTIIHGEFYPSNILIGKEGPKTRICPIDWETAAVGPALMDLAALVSGDWSVTERDVLARAYYDALQEPEAILGGHDFDRALRACRLHLAIRWLGWAASWEPPEEHRCDWLSEACELAMWLCEH